MIDFLDALVLGVIQGLAHRRDDAVQQGAGQLREPRARQARVKVLGARGVRGDERQVDLRLLGRGELDLRLLGGLVEALQGHRVRGEVDALVALEVRHEPVHDRLVEVVAAEVVIAGRRLDLEDAVADLQHRDVEGAAAEVEDQDRLVVFLVQAVRQRGRRRLVDDALDVQSGDLAGVLGRLALVVVEVRRHRDHGRIDSFAEIRFGIGLELLQDHRRDLRRRVLIAARFDARVAVGAGDDLVGDDRLLLTHLGLLAAHETLDREDRVLRVGDRLALGDGADEALAGGRERDHRGGRATALRVLDDGRLATLKHGHAGVVVPRSMPMVLGMVGGAPCVVVFRASFAIAHAAEI